MEIVELILSEQSASKMLDLVVSYLNSLDCRWYRKADKILTMEQRESMREEFRQMEPLLDALRNQSTRKVIGCQVRGVPQWKRVQGE